MKMKDYGTPTELAKMIAMGWLEAAYREATSDVSSYATTETERKALRKAIAKLHDRLGDQAKLDFLPLAD